MSVHVVGILRTKDWSWYKEYAEKVAELVSRHGGRYVLRGLGAETLEGENAPPSAVVVLEFPTIEHAHAWHRDPQYAPLIALRNASCDTELVLYKEVP